MEEHTTPAELGRIYSIARPQLGVGMHFTLDEALFDPLIQRWGTTYDDPVLFMQDLTTIRSVVPSATTESGLYGSCGHVARKSNQLRRTP